MKNTWYYLSLIVACATPTAGQTHDVDRVETTSHQIYKGIIIEQRPGESIRLWRLAEDDTIEFVMGDIERINKVIDKKEVFPPAKESLATPPIAPDSLILKKPEPFNQKHWYTTVGIGRGGGDYPVANFGFSTFYLPDSKQWLLGAGVQDLGEGDNSNNIPVYLQFSVSPNGFQKHRLGATLFTEIGYSLNLDLDETDPVTGASVSFRDGYYLFVGLKTRLNVGKNWGIMLDAGYARHTRQQYINGLKSINMFHFGMFRGSIFF